MKLYDTLSGEKKEFAPWDGKTVRLYVCGVTPYDTTHIGHAMTYLTFDVVSRYCQYLGWRVKYVQNVTDIDDDILKRSARDGEEWDLLGDRHTRQLVQDLSKLNVLWPQAFPRASEEVEKIVEMNKMLIEKGNAYESGGNIYFRVASDEDYGELGKYTHAEMIDLSRERGADPDDPLKEGQLDFILWQATKPGEPSWESPWGPGRPGWHIECSAMAMRYLGETIDIHGGGSDLIYPHHECEIAQSEHFTGKKPFTRFWMHIGMVEYQGEKMSKSLGNLVLAREVLRHHTPDATRLYLHSNHYRAPWSYRDTGPAEYEGLASLVCEAMFMRSGDGQPLDAAPFESRFRGALDDDLNTPEAVKVLHEFASDIVTCGASKHDITGAQERLRVLGGILGMSGVIYGRG